MRKILRRVFNMNWTTSERQPKRYRWAKIEMWILKRSQGW